MQYIAQQACGVCSSDLASKGIAKHRLEANLTGVVSSHCSLYSVKCFYSYATCKYGYFHLSCCSLQRFMTLMINSRRWLSGMHRIKVCKYTDYGSDTSLLWFHFLAIYSSHAHTVCHSCNSCHLCFCMSAVPLGKDSASRQHSTRFLLIFKLLRIPFALPPAETHKTADIP